MKQKLLLLDSIGAILSALFLVVIKEFEPIFGITCEIIVLLLPFPLLFSIYSFVAYFYSKNQWPLFLKGIAVGNLIYCFVTLYSIIVFFKKLTALGISYFLIEIIIIVSLAIYELKISSHNTMK